MKRKEKRNRKNARDAVLVHSANLHGGCRISENLDEHL